MSRVAGHYAPWVLTALLAVLIALTLVPAAMADVPWPVLALVLVATVLLAASILAHNRRLCERCIASLPLDASNVASRYAVRFRVAHLFEHKLFALGYLATLIGSAARYAHPEGRYAWALAQASLGYLVFVYVTHQRLQPWCPYCRNGGEELTAPTAPTPVSSHQ
jgi:hypothetical protein